MQRVDCHARDASVSVFVLLTSMSILLRNSAFLSRIIIDIIILFFIGIEVDDVVAVVDLTILTSRFVVC